VYEAAVKDKAGVDQMIYGTKIIPLFKIKMTTKKATITAGTTFRSFMRIPYRGVEIVSV
jgi:hypothetical protein